MWKTGTTKLQRWAQIMKISPISDSPARQVQFDYPVNLSKNHTPISDSPIFIHVLKSDSIILRSDSMFLKQFHNDSKGNLMFYLLNKHFVTNIKENKNIQITNIFLFLVEI